MSQYYDVTAISSDEIELEKVGKSEGVKTISVELTRKITPLKDLKALWNLYKLFSKEKPKIVHTHTPKAGLIGMIAAFLAKVPYRLHTVEGMPLMITQGLKRKILNLTEKTTYFCAIRVYPVSRGLYDFILENKLSSVNKMKIIANGSSNGINTEYFSLSQIFEDEKKLLKKKLRIAGNDFVFCFVGRLVRDKGINELVAVFSELMNQNRITIKLLLVGPFEKELDPLLPETEIEIQNNSNIISVNFQKDIRSFLAISDVFVFPSYREGFGNVIIEAGAMELPCIVTNITGCNEIITDGVNGLIIPPKDKKALKEKMELLLTNSDLRTKLKSNAREMITSRYEQKMVWEALLEEYKSLEGEL
jgi:glycosyltransferase involved in cell wall biosynthesis